MPIVGIIRTNTRRQTANKQHSRKVLYLSLQKFMSSKVYVSVVFICPIAIAYSYGIDNKISLRLSVCLSVCVSLSVCPGVITLTVAFLCRFSPNLTQRCKPPKVRTSSLGVNIAPPLTLFYP